MKKIIAITAFFAMMQIVVAQGSKIEGGRKEKVEKMNAVMKTNPDYQKGRGPGAVKETKNTRQTTITKTSTVNNATTQQPQTTKKPDTKMTEEERIAKLNERIAKTQTNEVANSKAGKKPDMSNVETKKLPAPKQPAKYNQKVNSGKN